MSSQPDQRSAALSAILQAKSVKINPAGPHSVYEHAYKIVKRLEELNQEGATQFITNAYEAELHGLYSAMYCFGLCGAGISDFRRDVQTYHDEMQSRFSKNQNGG